MEKQIKEIEQWKKIRVDLNTNYEHSENWDKAVNLFDKRLKQKYFEPISSLISTSKLQGEGFPIVTIQCALIETFAAFKEGVIYNHNKPEIGGIAYEYRDSSDLFVRFLTSEAIFEGLFYVIDKNKHRQNNVPFSATQFYTQVRCGLMHETRTKGKWVINATKNDNPKDKVFIKRRTKGYISSIGLCFKMH